MHKTLRVKEDIGTIMKGQNALKKKGLFEKTEPSNLYK